MKFDFSKSIETDFRNKLQLQFDILTKNTLYITYQVDKILKLIQDEQTDKGLQKQVDEYFEDETSPQTDSVEHPDDKRDLD